MEMDSYYVAVLIMALSFAHGCGGPRFLSRRMFEWISKGYLYVRSRLQLEDVPVHMELYGQLKQDSSTLSDAQAALGALDTFMECAGCTFPLREMADKAKIILACVQFQLLDRARSSMERMLEGLKSLGVLDAIRCNPELFEPLFCMNNNPLRLETIRDLFIPDVSPVGHNSRSQQLNTLAFWNDYLVDISEGEAQLQFGDILMFATGTDTIPPCGFVPSPHIEFLPSRPEIKYPTANTCSCILRLPVVYDEYVDFKRSFEFALLNTAGFGQA